jgi:hypothetical protein
LLGKQELARINTVYNPLFSGCIRNGLVLELRADAERFLLIFERSGSLGPYETESRVGTELLPLTSCQPKRAGIDQIEFVRD